MVLAVLAARESTLPSFCWSYKIQHKEATVTVRVYGGQKGLSLEEDLERGSRGREGRGVRKLEKASKLTTFHWRRFEVQQE